MYSLEMMVTANNKLRFSVRHWDGIDKPQYDEIETMTLEKARNFSKSLNTHIKTMEDALVVEKKKRKKEISREVEEAFYKYELLLKEKQKLDESRT